VTLLTPAQRFNIDWLLEQHAQLLTVRQFVAEFLGLDLATYEL